MAFVDTPTTLPGLDLADIDDKLRHIGAVESSWGLPPLPDEVKLDLVATQDRQGLGDLLYGLASDLNQTFNPLAAQPAEAQVPDVAPAAVTSSLFLPDPPGAGVAGAITDVTGFPRPEVVDPTAVLHFKRKAIGAGLLPPDTPLDTRWDPAFNAVAWEMRNDDFRRRLSGERTGAWTIEQVMDVIAEWTAPSNLLNVAVELDFLPDVQAIGREAGDWGKKWRHWWKHKTSPRAFIDALTGPIDDVAVPILNTALLVTGTSAIIGGVRALTMGAKAAQAANEVQHGLRTLYSAKAAFQAGEAAVAGARRASWLSRGLQFGGERLLPQAATPFTQGVAFGAIQAGEKMAAWRNLKGVKLASLGLQQGLRTGVVGTAEQKVFQGQEYVRDIEEFKHRPAANTPLGLGFDLLSIPVMPAAFFSRGTFTQLGRPAAALAERYRTVARESGAAIETARAWANLIEDPTQRATYLEKVRRNPTEALVEHLGGDHEKAGHLVSWASALTAIDADAIALANRVARDNPAKWKDVFLKTRNARIAQLRHIDEGDEETFLQIIREKRESGGRHTQTLFKNRLRDPATRDQALEDMNALIRDHNEKRNGVFQRLLEGLQPGMVESHVSSFFKHESDWDAFLVANDQLRQMTSREGLLDAAPEFIKPFEGGWDTLGDPTINRLIADVMDDPGLVSQAWLQPFARDIVPGRGRFTLARLDSVTKQDAVVVLSSLSSIRKRIEALEWLERNPDKYVEMVKFGRAVQTPFHELTPRDLLAGLREHFAAGLTAEAKLAARTLRSVSKQGLDPLAASSIRNAKEALRAQLDELNGHRMWSDWFRIPSSMTLEQKERQLRRMQNFLAGEVTGLPEAQVEHLRSLGYKVVHGAEFLVPNDLLDLVRPLAETTRFRMAQYSLGTFMHPVEDRAVWGLVSRRLHSEIAGALGRLGLVDRQALARSLDGEAGDVEDVIDRLYGFMRSRQNAAGAEVAVAEETGGLTAKFLANLKSNFAPHGLRDLSKKEIAAALQGTPAGDHPHAVNAIHDAILRAHDVGWRYNGMAAIEDHLRANGVLVAGLKLLSKTPSGGALLPKAVGAGAVLGGGMGGLAGWAQGQDPVEILGSAVGGAGMGALQAGIIATGARAAGSVARTALPRVTGSNWDRYTRLPQALVDLRNHLRFTLSPFFDLSRYIEGGLISQIHDLPDGMRLPLRGIKSLARDFGPEAPSEARRMWDAATRGEYGLVDETERYFRQKGILGYSPRDHQAASYYRMVRSGMDPQEAFVHTKQIYAYGLGRSPAEKTINFIFFPFSFQKKLLTHSGRFLANDLSRTLVLHDALKTYEVLNDEFNLSERWERHLPMLRQLQRLNGFRNISPGEFGGINRPLIEPLLEPVIQAFMPQGVILADKSTQQKLMSLMRRMVPVFNDVDRMLEDLQDQGHILMSEEHLSRKAEVEEGYAWWNAFKQNIDHLAKAQGYTRGYASIVSNPNLAPIREAISAYKAELGRRFPTWLDSRAETASRIRRDQDELNMLIQDPQNPGEEKLAFFAQVERELRRGLSEAGFSVENAPEDVPEDVYVGLRQLAAELAADGDEFRRLYRQFFQRVYGPITREV
jgi:hypothetical protein